MNEVLPFHHKQECHPAALLALWPPDTAQQIVWCAEVHKECLLLTNTEEVTDEAP